MNTDKKVSNLYTDRNKLMAHLVDMMGFRFFRSKEDFLENTYQITDIIVKFARCYGMNSISYAKADNPLDDTQQIMVISMSEKKGKRWCYHRYIVGIKEFGDDFMVRLLKGKARQEIIKEQGYVTLYCNYIGECKKTKNIERKIDLLMF